MRNKERKKVHKEKNKNTIECLLEGSQKKMSKKVANNEKKTKNNYLLLLTKKKRRRRGINVCVRNVIPN